ncbi:MAG: PfaD family polyunsaturated fatty acid/polyketide biosynthesis protein [Phycisphaerales bacterium]|nr:PfaD family polyunsaturated fatty acid/polyketide biosynthesis protein [Phycisphaerales bacterium]
MDTVADISVTRAARGWWSGDASRLRSDRGALADALHRVASPVFVVDAGRRGRGSDEPAACRPLPYSRGSDTPLPYGRGSDLAVADCGTAVIGGDAPVDGADALPLLGYVPVLLPEQLGDPAFRTSHGVRYAYVVGAMANGITSEALVEAAARAGMLAFFGAAGLDPGRVEQAIDRLSANLGDKPFGFNLIHSPNEPDLEAAIVELYLRRRVRCVSASAYLGLTLPLVKYRLAGIHRDADGRVVIPNRVVAKVSRIEVARKFFSPPPVDMVRALVDAGALTAEQAELAAQVPVAEDLTAEADSGGHTDNRPALALIPTMLALRDEMQARHAYEVKLRVGAAGGIATPASAAAAFAMGAAYVLTGTVNQACVESGTSDAVRAMLADAEQADVMMAPAADMFEMGVKVQVLKRGTMFALRARKLYELYRAHGSIEALPALQRAMLERDYFRCTLEEAWLQTRDFFATRDPSQNERAERDPKHKLALVFRKYLGQSSNWANVGEPTRQADYQVWCGPAMGAFNEWTRGSSLAEPARREAVTVAHNLLVGAAALTRANWLRAQGVALPVDAATFAPREPEALAKLLRPAAEEAEVVR